MILGIDHVQITIPPGSEREAREFYCDFLGMQEIEKPDNRKMKGGFWLKIEKFQMHVGIEDGVDRTKTKAHVAFRVNDLEAWRAKFRARGIEISESQPLPSAHGFEFRDPFGNRAELVQIL